MQGKPLASSKLRILEGCLLNQSKELENLMAQSNINGVVLLKQAGCSAVMAARGWADTLFCEKKTSKHGDGKLTPVSRF